MESIMNQQKVYKYGFISMVVFFFLYLFSNKVKTTVDSGAKKASDMAKDGIGKVKNAFTGDKNSQ
jgi:hypothetical protein